MNTREIETVSQKIVDLFGPGLHFHCNTEDGCYDDCENFDDFDIGDDHQRQDWIVEFVVNMVHDDVRDHLITIFGPVHEEFFRVDLNLNVNNWDVGKVHIVQVQDTITLIQHYDKV